MSDRNEQHKDTAYTELAPLLVSVNGTLLAAYGAYLRFKVLAIADEARKAGANVEVELRGGKLSITQPSELAKDTERRLLEEGVQPVDESRLARTRSRRPREGSSQREHDE